MNWPGTRHHVDHEPSGPAPGADLVARLTGDKPLPAAIIEQIVARTNGVPLFIEELTKTVLEVSGDYGPLAKPIF